MKVHKLLVNNILIKILLLFILAFPLAFTAQNMTIFGNVIDTLNNSAKKDAVVMLVRLSDSTMIDFKRTDENGGFYFSTPLDLSLIHI